MSHLLHLKNHIVLLGDPGAGKTTSLKRIAIGSLQPAEQPAGKGLPLLVRLRDLGGSGSLASVLLETIGIRIVYDEKMDSEAREALRLRILVQYLEKLGATVLIDGLDEVHSAARDRVVRELRILLLQSQSYRAILTCRTADFFFHFDNAQVFVLEPLSDEQILLFARKWLGADSAMDFLAQIRDTPYGGAEVLPLTLAHLCAIYQRTGAVPDKPRTVYRKIVRLLLEEWDEQRSVRRPSGYANFEVDRKEEFLRTIAFQLTTRARRGAFDHAQLEEAFLSVCETFQLPRQDSRKVVREIESHTGLIVEIAQDRYEFAHKSIQEYLTAEYLLRLPRILGSAATQLPNEMALATAMSSDPSGYFRDLVQSLGGRSEPDLSTFTAPYLRRLRVEKADFSPDAAFGEAIVALFSETYYPSRGQMRLPFDIEARVFEEFLASSPVRESVIKFITRGRLEHEQAATWRIVFSASEKTVLLRRHGGRDYYLINLQMLKYLGLDTDLNH